MSVLFGSALAMTTQPTTATPSARLTAHPPPLGVVVVALLGSALATMAQPTTVTPISVSVSFPLRSIQFSISISISCPVSVPSIRFGSVLFSASGHSGGSQPLALGSILHLHLKFVIETQALKALKTGIKRFSHYLVPSGRGKGVGSTLSFGSKADIHDQQHTTPFVENPKYYHYFINLTQISVGNTKVQLLGDAFKLTRYGTIEFMVDSITSYTMLKTTGFELFVALMKELSPKKVPKPITAPKEVDFCISDADFSGVPVTFHFQGGVDVKLGKKTTFDEYPEEKKRCLAIVVASTKINFWKLPNDQPSCRLQP